jgi:hypothetical protein
MNFPVSTKPAVLGALAGAAALAFIGFNWGGWVTAGTADKMAEDHARAQVVAALVPICIDQSKRDPYAVETLAELMRTTRYQRSDMLMEAGWATMPGSNDPDRNVATACMEELAAQF